VLCFLPSKHYPLCDFDLRATHARTLLPAALASVSFGFVLVRVRDALHKRTLSPVRPVLEEDTSIRSFLLFVEVSCSIREYNLI